MIARSLVYIVALAVVVSCGQRHEAKPPTTSVGVPADAITQQATQGPLVVDVAVWPARPLLGEHIYYRLTLKEEQPLDVTGDFAMEEFGRLAVERHTEKQLDAKTTEHTYELSAALSGRYRLPAFRLGVALGDSASELLIDEVPIEIAPPPPPSENRLRPAPAPLPVRVGGMPWWVVAAAAVLASLLVWALLRLRRTRTVAAHAVRTSAFAEAHGRLQRLQAAGAPDAGALEQWFVELSLVVRTYIEGRYGIRAPEKTTEEFLVIAAKHPDLSLEHRTLLQPFLRRCDEVKFAGYVPSPEESLAALDAALRFVEETKPATEVA